MKKLIIYGAGNRGKNLYELLSDEKSEYEVIAVLDGNSDRWGELFGDKLKVTSVDSLNFYLDIPICISVYNSRIIRMIRRKLEDEYGYNLSQEIEYEELVWNALEKKASFPAEIEKHKAETAIIFDSYMGMGLGGIEEWVKGISRDLLEHGWNNIHILTDQREYDILDELEAITDKVNRIEKNGTEDNLENFQHLTNYFSGQLPCIIITNRSNVELMATATVKKRYPDKVKIISVIHMGTEDTYRKYSIYQKYVDLYIGVSQDIKEGMQEIGIEKKRIMSMTCPFYCEKKLVRAYSEDVNTPVHIGYAGRLDSITPAQKRMDLLINCIDELLKRKVNFILEIAGDGPAKEDMQNWVEDRQCTNRVIFLGNISREKISDFWKHQDVCINLADFEGRSISIIEAMGNGAVPVVTFTSGVREDITDGVNGYTVPLGDYVAVVDRIELLEKNRMKLQTMGQAAHDSVYPKSLYSVHLDFWDRELREI